MAIPRVFVASTCYDLKYIRGNLQYFIRGLGFDPILSEEGDIFYDPSKHTHDSCVTEVSNCQLFVLIIGGRFGGEFRDTTKSITNAEYVEAINHKIPVFTLVEQAVYAEHHVYNENKNNKAIDGAKILYPAVDSTKIFDFIDEVRKASYNNALHPFQDFSDIEGYLKKQWAGLMFSFLADTNERERLIDTLSMLKDMNERIEMLSNQILQSIGTEHAKITIELYDEMMTWECVRDLSWWGLKPTPKIILQNDTFVECAKSLGKQFEIFDHHEYEISNSDISKSRLQSNTQRYKIMKQNMFNILKNHGITVAKYLSE
ncbi:MAG: hypothetical protein A2Y10_06670 [Planctomycetes bacterium GWF2_41_51]|nr:MAG: hypothetical protein A2Y10_06670 [Planctomycetes bacterium GWF2_41_51]HBG28150.1 hypothetical protein [Phycisphaerales bacterium]